MNLTTIGSPAYTRQENSYVHLVVLALLSGVLAQEAGVNYIWEWSEQWRFRKQNWDGEDKKN